MIGLFEYLDPSIAHSCRRADPGMSRAYLPFPDILGYLVMLCQSVGGGRGSHFVLW